MIDIATDSSEKVVKDLEVRGIISIFAEIIQLSQAKLASVERGEGQGAREMLVIVEGRGARSKEQE